jgi:hypothetical protein
MKLIVLIAAILLCSWAAQSQSQFGFFGGPQASTAHYAVNGVKQSTSYNYGFQLGMGWKIPFDKNLYFAPAFFYSMKGYKVPA